MSPLLQTPPPRPPPSSEPEDLSEEEGLERAAMATGDEFDDLGFASAPEGDSLGDSTKSYAQWFQPKLMRRLRRLEGRRAKLPKPGEWTSVPKATLKGLLRKGIPPEHRAEVWWSILGCETQRLQSPVAYEQYLKESLEPATSETIERDLMRTFPNHVKFRTAAGRGELRNVLHAFARRRPIVQYCQGLNFIAGLLLVVFEDEARAFWALVCAFDALGVEGYYTEGMQLLRADVEVLSAFMMKKCSKVARELRRLDIDLLAICTEWYMTWFAKSLPVGTVLRVWDTLFFEGFKVLFRISMGIFKRVEQEVMKCGSFDAVMEQAKHWPRRMVQHNELLKASFQGLTSLKRRDLLQARDEALCKIEKKDLELRRAAQAQREARALLHSASRAPAPSPTKPATLEASQPVKIAL
eukprot:TRINITY_DN61515_c0_g1_i1.p1 TRINITY_DN61515_c0_g1~~TRINITY_DN61515_c0_g1_i1.p1  ORF type:complete len:411 (-),score=97.41 TRINITY_DN61515_c0_g1_i1:56-1288(-)